MEVIKIKYFKNVTSTSADFYIYGAIVDEKEADWWTGETSKTEIDINESIEYNYKFLKTISSMLAEQFMNLLKTK